MEEIKRVLVPVDFSENSDRILDSACFLAGKFGATVHVVFVVQSLDDYSGFFVPHVPMAQFEQELVQAAQEKIADFIGQRTIADSKVLIGDVGEQIVTYAEEMDADLIVMGTHGYKGLERIMFGSVANTVVKTAPCPVLTINPYRGEAKD